MIFDPVRGRMILYGGWEGRLAGDTWELTLDPQPRWRRMPDRGYLPPPRYSAAAAYDSRRDAMVIMGGIGGTGGSSLRNDVWALSFADGDTWLPVSTLGSSPQPRAGHRMIYDARRDRMIVLWGDVYSSQTVTCSELDMADGPTWRPFAPDGAPAAARSYFGAAYDPARDLAVVIGGSRHYDTGLPFADVLIGDFSGNPVTSPPTLHGPPLTVYGLAPNPTRDVLNLAFELPVDADVHAFIYDASGRAVRDMGRKHYVAGRHLLVWDGKNNAGAVPASGVYFARFEVLGRNFSGKFVLLR
jgi:hypothetical protein